MSATHRRLGTRLLKYIGILGVLIALVLFHAINNWLWLKANVTLLGWDVPSHLTTSFIYDSILRPVTLRTLFEAIIWHSERPPLLFLSAVPFYRLFGLSDDIGTMVNVVYLAVLIGSVYGIGQRLGGWRVGLLAAFVVATFPMIYGISRYFNIELALAAMVALSLYLLLASDRFENRSASLLFGLSFGLGLLTKRTYLVFVCVPLVFVVLRSGALQSLTQRLKAGIRLSVKDVLLPLGVGLPLAAVWYLPSREVARDLLLGDWLLLLWTLLIAATVYLLRLEPGADTNLLSAIFLGATVGSLWYLPRITFVQRLLRFGYGVNDPWERSANLDNPGTYGYFLVRLINEHLSLVTFALLLVAMLGLILLLRRRGHIGSTLWRADDAWWVVALWVLASYLILTFSLYRKSRGIVPLLPGLAVILAAGLLRLPWKKVIPLLVVLLLAWGLLQFFVLSYPSPHWLAEQTQFTLPLLGKTSLFAQGGPLQLPASGYTDPGYWVVSDVLQIADDGRQEIDAESVHLGVVVNNEHVNPDLFHLVAREAYPGVRTHGLARTWSEGSIYGQLFEQDYLVLIEHNYQWIDPAAEKALRHLTEAPGFFEAAFELERRFPLPDGDTVLLYRKVQRLEPAWDTADYQSVAQTLAAWPAEDGAILLVPPEQVEALARAYDGSLPPYLLPQQQPLDPEATARALEEITGKHSILFAVFRDEATVDPDRFVEGWLNEHAYLARAEWHGGTRLLAYGAPTDVDEIEHALDARLGEQIWLLGHTLSDGVVEPGGMVRLDLFWQAYEPPAERYTVFAHLLDGNGQLVAQQDGEPVGGFRPTTTWSAAEVIHDRVGLLLPTELDAGEYHLVVGMYHPDTGERLPVIIAGGSDPATGDSIPLTAIQVREP